VPGVAEVAVGEVGKDLPVLRRQRVLSRLEVVAEHAAADSLSSGARSQFLAGRLNGYSDSTDTFTWVRSAGYTSSTYCDLN
jgi:hypothetical protein